MSKATRTPEEQLTISLYRALGHFLSAQIEEPWTWSFDYADPGGGRFLCPHGVELTYAEWIDVAKGNIIGNVRELLELVDTKHTELAWERYGRPTVITKSESPFLWTPAV